MERRCCTTAESLALSFVPISFLDHIFQDQNDLCCCANCWHLGCPLLEPCLHLQLLAQCLPFPKMGGGDSHAQQIALARKNHVVESRSSCNETLVVGSGVGSSVGL